MPAVATGIADELTNSLQFPDTSRDSIRLACLLQSLSVGSTNDDALIGIRPRPLPVSANSPPQTVGGSNDSRKPQATRISVSNHCDSNPHAGRSCANGQFSRGSDADSQ